MANPTNLWGCEIQTFFLRSWQKIYNLILFLVTVIEHFAFSRLHEFLDAEFFAIVRLFKVIFCSWWASFAFMFSFLFDLKAPTLLFDSLQRWYLASPLDLYLAMSLLASFDLFSRFDQFYCLTFLKEKYSTLRTLIKNLIPYLTYSALFECLRVNCDLWVNMIQLQTLTWWILNIFIFPIVNLLLKINHFFWAFCIFVCFITIRA